MNENPEATAQPSASQQAPSNVTSPYLELFSSLPETALWKYLQRYEISVPKNATIEQLAEACSQHFAQQPQQKSAMNQATGEVNEKEVLPWFIYRVRHGEQVLKLAPGDSQRFR